MSATSFHSLSEGVGWPDPGLSSLPPRSMAMDAACPTTFVLVLGQGIMGEAVFGSVADPPQLLRNQVNNFLLVNLSPPHPAMVFVAIIINSCVKHHQSAWHFTGTIIIDGAHAQRTFVESKI